MRCTPKHGHEAGEESGLEDFLSEAEASVGSPGGPGASSVVAETEPAHRRLRVVVSSDRLEARFEALFPDTTWQEVKAALRRNGIGWGIQERSLREALERADRTGRAQRNVLAAKGRVSSVNGKREVRYPFLEGIRDPETGEPLHTGSAILRGMDALMAGNSLAAIRAYNRPAVAVFPGAVLVQEHGDSTPGRDVFGRELPPGSSGGSEPFRPGEGVVRQPDGLLVANRFGYVAATNGLLRVVSPVWVSPDRMEAHFVNPPHLGRPELPGPDTLLKELEALGICHGVDRERIRILCQDLAHGRLRESCVRIAQGTRPATVWSGLQFSFDPSPDGRFEALIDALDSGRLPDADQLDFAVQAVHPGDVLAEQVAGSGHPRPGTDLFGQPVVPPPVPAGRRRPRPGRNVKREVRDGRIRYVSQTYGYAGIADDRIAVLSPIWVSSDWMRAYYVWLPQPVFGAPPRADELNALLDQAAVRHGIDSEALRKVSKDAGADLSRAEIVEIARGTPPRPGADGRITLLFKHLPDPGKLLDQERMDFRERDAVPAVVRGEVLARRTLPQEGEAGCDVRGKRLEPPRPARPLLYAGPNVRAEDGEKEQVFRAEASGWARIVGDRLSVLQRYRHRGDVDFQVGNIRMEGDVEISGTVKSGFKVEATGDVYVGGSVERNAELTAGGNVVVGRGVVGGRVKAGGDFCARFVQQARVEVEGNLKVRNYIQDSEARLRGKATVEGHDGGIQQLCILGGTLVAAGGIEAASIGSRREWPTRVIAGIDPALESRLSRYRNGVGFADLRIRRAVRSIDGIIGEQADTTQRVEAVRRVPPAQRAFLHRQLKDLQTMRRLKESLAYHVEDLQKQRAELAKQARIRASRSVFPKVTVQVGDISKPNLTQQRGTVFRQSLDGLRVIQESI